MPNRPGNPVTIEPLNAARYQKGWQARLKQESWWHFNWLEPSWRAGWKDAGKELAGNPEIAAKVTKRTEGQRPASSQPRAKP